MMQSAVIGAWSDAVTVTAVDDPTKPSATMSGLRFDGSRSTVLSRQMEVGSTWTYSAWIKKTESPDFDLLSQGLASFQARLLFQSTGKFTFLGDGGNLTTSNTFDLNTWHHVVFTADNTNISISVNGGTPETGTVTSKFSQALTRIGNTESPAATIGNGYLSDVYFVDGEALEPEVFGKSFEGKWGPLDSAVVLENIKGKTKSPYEERPNMDQKWSDDFSTSSSYLSGTAANVFDGDLSTKIVTTGRTDTTVSLAPTSSLPVTTSIEVYIMRDSLADQAGLGYEYSLDGATKQINGSELGADMWVALPELVGKTISSTTPFVVTSKNLGSSDGPAIHLNAIRVDGRILVDGPADNSQNWSMTGTWTATSNGAPSTLTEVEKVFDGDTTKGPKGPAIYNGEVYKSTYTFAQPIDKDDIDSITLWTNWGQDAYVKYQVQINDGPIQTSTDGLGRKEIDATDFLPAGEDLRSFSFIAEASGTVGTGHFYGIAINGKILVDSGTQWDQSQVWSDGLSFTGTDNNPDPTGAFAGNTYDGAPGSEGFNAENNNNTQDITVKFTNDILKGASKVRLRTGGGGASSKTSVSTTAGLINIYDVYGVSTTWVDISSIITSATDYLELLRPAADGNNIRLWGIEVDGKVLVDPGSLGSNGFYLPFDPDEQGLVGKKWSDGTTAGTTQQDWNVVFNGQDEPRQLTSNNGQASLTLTNSIPFTESLRVRGQKNKNATGLNVYINDVPVPFSNADALQWVEMSSLITSPVTKIAVEGNGGAQSTALCSIAADGFVLIDDASYSGIGNDASGNGNHFQDENFITDWRGTVKTSVLSCVNANENYAVLKKPDNDANITLSNGKFRM